MRQWWELKSKHYDAVLFFKVMCGNFKISPEIDEM